MPRGSITTRISRPLPNPAQKKSVPAGKRSRAKPMVEVVNVGESASASSANFNNEDTEEEEEDVEEEDTYGRLSAADRVREGRMERISATTPSRHLTPSLSNTPSPTNAIHTTDNPDIEEELDPSLSYPAHYPKPHTSDHSSKSIYSTRSSALNGITTAAAFPAPASLPIPISAPRSVRPTAIKHEPQEYIEEGGHGYHTNDMYQPNKRARSRGTPSPISTRSLVSYCSALFLIVFLFFLFLFLI